MPDKFTFDGAGINLDGRRILTGSRADWDTPAFKQAGNLLAAAPKLLAALEAVAAIGEAGIIEIRETGKPTWNALTEVAKTARAAIAAAEGSAPAGWQEIEAGKEGVYPMPGVEIVYRVAQITRNCKHHGRWHCQYRIGGEGHWKRSGIPCDTREGAETWKARMEAAMAARESREREGE